MDANTVYRNSFVPKFYRMDPKTDDLLVNGRKIRNGMKILIERPWSREEVSLFYSPHPYNIFMNLDELQIRKAKKYNRWSVVSNYSFDGTVVHFVGTHDDGTKDKYDIPCGAAWYVKKDSIPESNLCDKCFAGEWDSFICISDGCKNFKSSMKQEDTVDSVEIQYNVYDYQGRQCTKCRYGHIYGGVCTTQGCTHISITRELFSLEELRERLGASFGELLRSKQILNSSACTNKILEILLKDFDVYEKIIAPASNSSERG